MNNNVKQWLFKHFLRKSTILVAANYIKDNKISLWEVKMEKIEKP